METFNIFRLPLRRKSVTVNIMSTKIKLDLETKNTSNMGPSPVSSEDYAYPEFTVVLPEEDDEDTETEPDNDLDDAPEEGIMTIQYRRKRTTEDNTRDECSYTFCITKIVSVECPCDEAPAKSYDDASSALDKLAAEKSKESY